MLCAADGLRNLDIPEVPEHTEEEEISHSLNKLALRLRLISDKCVCVRACMHERRERHRERNGERGWMWRQL